jgi:hypothetical protein
MRKILAMAILLVATAPALAADNAVVATPGSGLVMRSRDTTGAGGPQQPFVGLGNDSGVSVIGGGTTVPVSGTVSVGTPAVTQSGTWTVQQGTPPWTQNLTTVGGVTLGSTAVVNYGSTPAAVAVPGVNAFVTNALASVAAGTANTGASSPVVLAQNQLMADPCTYALKTNVAINGTANVQLVAASGSGQKVYVCSMMLVANAAVAVSVIEGTGSVCATGPAAVIGSSTAVAATNGLQLAANSGWTIGSGTATIASTATNNTALCLLVSSAVQVAGNITYVQR